MDAAKAVALALRYVDGLRGVEHPPSPVEAEAFLDHLTRNGFVVRQRVGGEHRGSKPTIWQTRRVTPEAIRARRQALGLGVGAFALKAGVSLKSLGKIEAGERAPQAKTLDRILDALARLEATGR